VRSTAMLQMIMRRNMVKKEGIECIWGFGNNCIYVIIMYKSFNSINNQTAA
jgi:hypothetical protein